MQLFLVCNCNAIHVACNAIHIEYDVERTHFYKRRKREQLPLSLTLRAFFVYTSLRYVEHHSLCDTAIYKNDDDDDGPIKI